MDDKFRASKGRSYAFGWCGPEGVIAGLKAVSKAHTDCKNVTVTFMVADHHTNGDNVYFMGTVGIATINGGMRWRWCGEGNNPDGAGSTTICWYDPYHPDNLAEATACVMFELARHQGQHPDTHIFRKCPE